MEVVSNGYLLTNIYNIIAQHRNPVGFLLEVWSPLQATVHRVGLLLALA
jgi:hypothetical protein